MGKSSGPRRKSRSALTKSVRERGRLGLSRLLTRYDVTKRSKPCATRLGKKKNTPTPMASDTPMVPQATGPLN